MCGAASAYGSCAFSYAWISFPWAPSARLQLHPPAMIPNLYATYTANTYVSCTATGTQEHSSGHCLGMSRTRVLMHTTVALTSIPTPACAAASRRAPHPSRFALLSALDCNYNTGRRGETLLHLTYDSPEHAADLKVCSRL